jgi:hypothetical protein
MRMTSCLHSRPNSPIVFSFHDSEEMGSPTWNDTDSSKCPAPTPHGIAPIPSPLLHRNVSAKYFPPCQREAACSMTVNGQGPAAEASVGCENQVECILKIEQISGKINECIKTRWRKLLLRLSFVITVNKMIDRLQASLVVLMTSDRTILMYEEDRVNRTRHFHHCPGTNRTSLNDRRIKEQYEWSLASGTRSRKRYQTLVMTDSHLHSADQPEDWHPSPVSDGHDHSPTSAASKVTFTTSVTSPTSPSSSYHFFSEKNTETVTPTSCLRGSPQSHRQGQAHDSSIGSELYPHFADQGYQSSCRKFTDNSHSENGFSDFGGYGSNSSICSSSNNSTDSSPRAGDTVTRNKSVDYGSTKRSKTHLKKCRSAQDTPSTCGDVDTDTATDAVMLSSSAAPSSCSQDMLITGIASLAMVESGACHVIDDRSPMGAQSAILNEAGQVIDGSSKYPAYDSVILPGKAVRKKRDSMHIHTDVMREINEEINREMNHEIERELIKERRESLKQMTCKMCKFVDEEMFEPGQQAVDDHAFREDCGSPTEAVQGRAKRAVMARRSDVKGVHRLRSLPELSLAPSPSSTARFRIQEPSTQASAELRARTTKRCNALRERSSSTTRCRNPTSSAKPSYDSPNSRQTDKAGKTDIKRQATQFAPGPALSPLQCPPHTIDAAGTRPRGLTSKRMIGSQTPSPLQSPLASRQGSRRIALSSSTSTSSSISSSTSTSPLSTLSAAVLESEKSCFRAESGTGSCVHADSEADNSRSTETRFMSRNKNNSLVSPTHRLLPKIEKTKSQDSRPNKVAEVEKDRGSEKGHERSVGKLYGCETVKASPVPKALHNDSSKIDDSWNAVESDSELPRSVLLAALKAGLPSRLWSMIPAITMNTKVEGDLGKRQHIKAGSYSIANGVATCVSSSYDTTPKTSRLPTPRTSTGAVGKNRSDVTSTGVARAGGTVAGVGVRQLEENKLQRLKDEILVRHFLEVSEDSLS